MINRSTAIRVGVVVAVVGVLVGALAAIGLTVLRGSNDSGSNDLSSSETSTDRPAPAQASPVGSRADLSPSAPSTDSGTSLVPSYNPSAGDADPSDEQLPAEAQDGAWGPVADRFARSFTRVEGGAAAWRERLKGDAARPDVTTAVAQQLETVDIRNVPDGRFEDRELLQSNAYEVAVKVTYDTDWAMVLWLNTDGARWQIYAYDRWEQ